MKVEVQQNFIIVLFKTYDFLNFMCIMVILKKNNIIFKLLMDNGYYNCNKFTRITMKLIDLLKNYG